MRNLVAHASLRLGLGGEDVTFLSYRCPPLRRIAADDVETAKAQTTTTTEGGEEEEEEEEEVVVEDDEDEDEDEDDDEDDDDDAGVGGSLLLDVTVPLAEDYLWPSSPSTTKGGGGDGMAGDADGAAIASIMSRYRCAGWELNRNGRPGPRSVDLRPLVSPSHLARQANDLNLRLMKWRALPRLDVDMLSGLKVLILGAGTLGCGVARTLLGWGVRDITFVDSGRVSYSNPVRQSLFVVDDCAGGGKFKATAAAEALSAIAGPDVRARGVVLSIPMPGHAFGGGRGGGKDETDAVRSDVKRLHRLVDESDVVFLLTDTRESRWLPTVMALATGTPLVNAALGLDSWLVMRHGPPSSGSNDDDNGGGGAPERLGCYFCGDVVAPENSTRDRTLDQQCTVTRPGLAPIAASMATELMVAMFHHPMGHRAPAPGRIDGGGSRYAPVDDAAGPDSSPLGRLPHQIRGTVATYTMMTPTVPAFASCTACSDRVVEEYRGGGFDFVKSVCCDEDGSYLEGVSGLAAFRELAAKKLEECMDWDDDED
jgi:ubiquitin-like modifier-activating enzyme ATG7